MAEFDLNDIAKHYKEMNDSDIIRIATQAAKGLRPEVFIIIENEISKRKLNPDIMKGVIAQSKEYTLEELEFFAEKIRELSCPICNQKKNKLNGTVAFTVKSFVLVTTFEKKHIIACPNCLNKENKKSIKSTLLFGWWGIPWGIIKTPQFVYKNISIKKQNHNPKPNETLIDFTLQNIGEIEIYYENPKQLKRIIAPIK